MSEPLAAFVVAAWQWYAVAGLAFAAAFVTRGVGRIDPMAREAPWTFRLLIVPGVVVWWPLLLVRWLAGSIAPPVETTAHRRRARGFR